MYNFITMHCAKYIKNKDKDEGKGKGIKIPRQ